jgi:hypothetical protein
MTMQGGQDIRNQLTTEIIRVFSRKKWVCSLTALCLFPVTVVLEHDACLEYRCSSVVQEECSTRECHATFAYALACPQRLGCRGVGPQDP